VKATKRRAWWTKQRVIEGLKRFYSDRSCAPTSSEEWQELTAGSAVSLRGFDNPYPSTASILRHFPSFREAWTAAGVEVNRDLEPWTGEEERFIAEGAGIFSRKELAQALNRTPNAVHRRLYDLGISTYKARGWTFHRVMRATGVPDYVLRRYANRGELPYLRGSKCLYVDPADILVIEEIDWSDPPAELAEDIWKSLMRRLVSVIARRDWRHGCLYQLHKTNTTNMKQRRRAQPAGPKPNEIKRGDLVRALDDPNCKGLVGRVGHVHAVYWSAYRQQSSLGRDKKETSGEWVARVEFKRDTARNLPRANRTLPLTALKEVKK